MGTKIKDLKEKAESIYLSSWQRLLTWTKEDMLFLIDTILKAKQGYSYCKINPIKIGTYPPQQLDGNSLVFRMEYIEPVVGQPHVKIGSKRLAQINHLQDGQQRMTSLLFMLFGKTWKENNKLWQLYFDIADQSFEFIARTESGDRPVLVTDGVVEFVKASTLFDIFMNTQRDTDKAVECNRLGFDYEDVKDTINHILGYEIDFDYKQYNNITEALDDFKRTNAGRPLSDYALFINNLVEYVGDFEFDKFFDDGKKKVNDAVPGNSNYFSPQQKGKEDFALNMMSFRADPYRTPTNLSGFKKYIIKGENGCIETDPVNETTIDAFQRKLSRFITKLLNTKIEVNSTSGETWETYLPYDILFKNCRLPMLALLRHMGSANGMDARSTVSDPLPKQGIRFLIHHLCLNNKAHSKHTPFSKRLFGMRNLDQFENETLEVDLDEIDPKVKIRLVASSYNNTGISESTIFSNITKAQGYNVVVRSEGLLTDDLERQSIEILPENHNIDTEEFFNERKREINQRLKDLLSEYDITVINHQ